MRTLARSGRGALRHRHRLGAIGAALIVAAGALGVVAGAPGAGSPLPACPSTATWPVKPVSAPVVAALARYYGARHLTPVSVRGHEMWVLSVPLESAGVHWCRNAGGGRSGYVGVVPRGATGAVLVEVTHRAYPVTGSRTTFATVARLATGWRVVSDDTGP